MPKENIRVTVVVDQQLHDRVQAYAFLTNRSITKTVSDMLDAVIPQGSVRNMRVDDERELLRKAFGKYEPPTSDNVV